MLADLVDHVLGVDPDRDRVTIAVVNARTQGVIATNAFPTTPRGYREALRWAGELTEQGRRSWAIEGAGGYGAGLAASLAVAREHVIEFDHPTARPSKDGAKTDALDAIRAARETLGRSSWATPRARGAREGLRTLIAARDSAKIARVSAINILKALIVACPVKLREELRRLTLGQLVTRCQRFRIEAGTDPEMAATKLALRSTATRIHHLTEECRNLENAMKPLVTGLSPRLLAEPGVGVLVAAQLLVSWSHPGRCRSEAAFARLAGVAPLPATSGQTQTRHRLSRGGDRQLNRVIHTAVLTRVKTDAQTRDYLTRRMA